MASQLLRISSKRRTFYLVGTICNCGYSAIVTYKQQFQLKINKRGPVGHFFITNGCRDPINSDNTGAWAPCGDSSARQALSAACATPAPWGRQPGGHLFFLPAVGKEDQDCSHQPVGTETWVLWVHSALVWGSLHPDALGRSCRFGLGCGQSVWFAPQGVLTKLDRTCTNEISHKYCSYIFSWIQATLSSVPAWHPQPGAAEQLPLKIGGCPPFAVAPSLCVIVFRENILLCSRLFHKGKNKM